MFIDSIVEEVRKHREARAAKFGFNVRAIVKDARKRQKTSGHPIVDLAQEGQKKRCPIAMRKSKARAASR